jgi:hypothetical protein
VYQIHHTEFTPSTTLLLKYYYETVLFEYTFNKTYRNFLIVFL